MPPASANSPRWSARSPMTDPWDIAWRAFDERLGDVTCLLYLTRDIELHRDDIVVYDAQGYPLLRDFLKRHGVRHVLLTGYATDMCFCKTTAGYENLSKDFNVFLVGDATLATFPANKTPRYATNTHISFAALNQLVTQVSWIKYGPVAQARE